MNGHLARRAILAASMALPASSVFAQGTADLVGTWRLVSSVSEKDGKTTDQFGTGADGMMSLDANGRFMLTIIGPDLPNTRTSRCMTCGPAAHADRHDAPGLIGESVPSVAAVIDDGVV